VTKLYRGFKAGAPRQEKTWVRERYLKRAGEKGTISGLEGKKKNSNPNRRWGEEEKEKRGLGQCIPGGVSGGEARGWRNFSCPESQGGKGGVEKKGNVPTWRKQESRRVTGTGLGMNRHGHN